ncbi:phosphoribosylformylglycinamidine synthase subunit PurS [Atopobacter sp. AH10]|uniref:phosphoribosylformylglycinamidine synthase subunit PurS n=1 Tax=Atopobacter sp. AH10 TaxID=2315861 RepID=UPI000EF27265|nr:phosphoribosylformylglycinamidine synthase subunit PurS [Atopobacter sp. AH10]RLK63997.1 phosphoribosylformylglycinamidine synthase subunit PurS [Atopobacter sp. AH10]
MYLAKVYVTYKESILDPKGEAIKKAVHQMNYDTVQNVRLGKYIEILVDDNDPAHVEKTIDEISDKLLANVTMESYRYTVEEV